MMIEVIDRIPTYPGRVKLVPVEGQENTFDMARADAPIEVGTPINKALFDSYAAKINAAVQNMDNKVFELSQRVEISTLRDGALFGLYENGVLVPYIKMQSYYRISSGFNAQDFAMVVRRDCVTTMPMYETPHDPVYAGSNIDLWLQSEFVNTLDEATRSVMPSANVQIINESAEKVTIVRDVFLLSLTEYNVSNLPIVPIGNEVDYFANGDDSRKISNYKGSPVKHYTRSASPSNGKASVINENGVAETVDETTVAGVRPAFLLPLTFEVTAGIPSTANVTATAEVV